MPYIPKGADQQGRRDTGVWTSDDIGRSAWSAPHRTHQPDGAHAASEVQGDEPADTDHRSSAADAIVMLLGAVCALLSVATLLHLAFTAGWL